jgi:drug/metabolite transporter (DMT)-like permease
MQRMDSRAKLAIILCTFIGASTIVIAEPLVAVVPPLFLLGIRFILAAVLLALAVPRRVFPVTQQAVYAGVVAGLGFGLGAALLYLALPHVRAGKLAFLIALEVVLVPITSVVLYKRSLAQVEWLALVPAILGLWLLCGDADKSFSWWEGVGLLSAFAYSVYTISLSQLSAHGGVASRTFISCFVIGVIALLVSLLLEPQGNIGWSMGGWMSLAYLVIVGSVGRFLIQAWAQRSVSASFTALTFSAEPVFTIALSFVFLGERFTLLQSAGAGCIMLALFLVNCGAVSSGNNS